MRELPPSQSRMDLRGHRRSHYLHPHPRTPCASHLQKAPATHGGEEKGAGIVKLAINPSGSGDRDAEGVGGAGDSAQAQKEHIRLR